MLIVIDMCSIFCVFCSSIAVGEEDSSVSKLVEMTEERTATLVPMETSQQQQQQQQNLPDQQNGPIGATTIGGVGEILAVRPVVGGEGVGFHEDDNSSEDDS
jgi:hypothetical protein